MPMCILVWKIEINAETPLEATVLDIIAEDGEVTQVVLLSDLKFIVLLSQSRQAAIGPGCVKTPQGPGSKSQYQM